MSDPRNRLLMQTKDISVIVGIVTILGYLFTLSRHAVHWDDMVNEVAMMKPALIANTTAVAVIESQYNDIKADLRDIKQSQKIIKRNTGG